MKTMQNNRTKVNGQALITLLVFMVIAVFVTSSTVIILFVNISATTAT